MRALSRLAKGVALGVLISISLATFMRQQLTAQQGSGVGTHDHSSGSKGGSTLRPLQILLQAAGLITTPATSTVTISGYFSPVHLSSSTGVIASGTGISANTGTTFAGCNSSGTVSQVPISTGPLVLFLNGSADCGGANPQTSVWMLINGKYVAQEDATHPLQFNSCPGGAIPESMTISYFVPEFATAQTTFTACVGWTSTGGGSGAAWRTNAPFGAYQPH